MKTKLLPSYGYSAAMLFIALCCTPNLLIANPIQDKTKVEQNKVTITGKVTDESGALPGVIVQIVGTKTATLTDHDGNYSIQVDLGSELSYSYMGYTIKKVLVTSADKLNITLSQDSQELDEIIVNAGYYTVKDRERTGSIARVTSKDIEFQPVINPLQAIQGRVAGLDITQHSGIPGGGMQVEIRGRNFMDSGANVRNQPLYIINGIPINGDPIGLGAFGSQVFRFGISPLNSINPNDIKSIEVLKDADATAIYGSRGANGVILITTKEPIESNLKYTFSSSLGYSKVANFITLLNTEQYLKIRKEAFSNSGIQNYPVSHYDVNGTWDQTNYTDWQRELIGNTALEKNINIGASGGTDMAAFNINASHTESTTVFPTDNGYKRNSISLSFLQKSKNNKFQLNSNVNYSEQSNNLPQIDLTDQAIKLVPNSPKLYTTENKLNWENNTFTNPLGQLENSYKNKITTIILSLNTSYEILANLKLNLNGGITKTNFSELKLNPHTAANPALGFTSENSNTSKYASNTHSFIFEPQLSFTKSWSTKALEVLAGLTINENTTDNIRIRGANFSSNAFLENISAAKTINIDADTKTEYKYFAFFARVNYTHAQKYILNLTARRDGSSRFASHNKFSNFGAIGAAWIVSKEKFLQTSKLVSFLKLRGSYGITGSDNIGDYSYLDTYNFSSLYNNNVTLQPTALYNPNYKWENTTKFELALELELFRNRIATTIAYYNNRSTDQLVGYTLPTTTGFNSITMNSVATVENKGWEFTISTSNIASENFNWKTNFNISFPKNTLISYPGLKEGTQSSTFIIGKPLNIVKTYEYLGIDQDTGLYLFTDHNKDGILNTLDQQTIKNLNPEFIGGLQNTLSLKNFTLDFLFYFIKKDAFNMDRNFYNTPGSAMRNLPIQVLNYKSNENPHGRYIAPIYGNSSTAAMNTRYTSSDATISDGSYIRLKNLSLSYDLKLPSRKIDKLRIYFQGQNLWTITKFYGMDPEFISTSQLPPLKTYSMGIQLTF